ERSRAQRNAIARIAEDEDISSGNMTGSFEKLTEEITVVIQVERASIWLFSDDKIALRCITLFENSTKKHSSGAILKSADYPHYFEAINNESRISAADAQNDERTSEFTEGYLVPLGISSMLDAGIYAEGELKGVVCLEHTAEKRTWYSDEESFASTIASMAGQMLANTERKHAEKILEAIITENPISIQIVDTEGFTLQVNSAHTALFGAVPPANYSVFDDFQLKQQGFGELIERVTTGEVVHFPDLYYNAHHLDSGFPDVPVWIQMVIFPLSDSNGKPERFVLMHENITGRKQAENAIKEALVKAEAGNRLKTAFMNNISHEIRTPLNAILGFSNLIIEPDITDEEKVQFYSLINTSSQRLLHTVTSYMDISLITSGTMEVKRNPIDLHLILHQLFNQFQPLCAHTNIRLYLEIPAKAKSFTLHSDEELLQKIFSHILDNAVKFTHQGEITFGYKVQPAAYEFYVKDTGSGIGQESLSLIFESFLQEELSPTRGHEGSGLGLSIAQGLVRLLGGEMRVESEKGIGSTFFFIIPHEVIKEAVVMPETVRIEGKVHDSPVVMIAEDDESNLKLIKAMLKKTTVTVLSANNGKEAVEQCHAHPEISLVLMDLKMPVMDGLEATLEIKSFRK
ncbi:MAG: ATP-binding protein, partial [Bacteroidota bacterium]